MQYAIVDMQLETSAALLNQSDASWSALEEFNKLLPDCVSNTVF